MKNSRHLAVLASILIVAASWVSVAQAVTGGSDTSRLFPLPSGDEVFDLKKTGAPTTVDGTPFRVLSQSADVAESQGKKVYRYYTRPRAIYDDNGIFRVRPNSWSAFGEKPETKVTTAVNGGYQFDYTLTSGEKIRVSAGEWNMGKALRKPAQASVTYDIQNSQLVSTLSAVYPGVNVSFVDSGETRQRMITLTEKPSIDKNTKEIVFWEEYDVPAGSSIVGWNEKPIANGSRLDVFPVLVKTPRGEFFKISPAIAYDNSKLEENGIAAPTIVQYDKARHLLRLGVSVPTSYLNNPKRQYPVTIDPTYYACGGAGGGNINLGCTGYVDYYYRQNLSAGVLAVDDRVTVAPANPFVGAGLFTGYNTTGPNDRVAREMAVLFGQPTFQNIIQDGTVTQATANFYYLGTGAGTYNNAVTLETKFLNNNCGANVDINTYTKFQDFSACVQSLNNGVAITQANTNRFYNWDIKSKIDDWTYFYTEDRGLIVVPSAAWNGVIKTAGPAWNDRLLVFKASEDQAPYTGNYPYLLITKQYADLVDAGSTIGNATAGTNAAAAIRVKNQGAGDDRSLFNVSYYITPLANCGTSVNAIAQGSYNSVNLSAGQSAPVQNVSIPIPQNTAAGTYCMYVDIDRPNVVYEDGRDGNNTATIQFSISGAPQPDLSFQSAALGAGAVSPGGTITVNTTVQNSGNANAGASTMNFYLDGNVLLGSQNVPALNAGATFVSSPSVTIPNNTALGAHTITARLDVFTQVTESNEFNNDSSPLAFTVTGSIDLAASSFSPGNNQVFYTGKNLTVSVPVRNFGNGDANNVDYQLRLRDLQTNSLYQLINLNPATFNAQAGFNQSVTFVGTIPGNLPPASYYEVAIILDPNNATGDINRNNNTAYSNANIYIEQQVFPAVDNNGNGIPDNAEVQAGIRSPNPTVPLANKNAVNNNMAIAPDRAGVAVAAAQKTLTNAPSTPAVVNQGGDPVNVRTGALELEQDDLKMEGRGQYIHLTRNYDSRTADISGRFGNGWTSSYDMYYYQDQVTKNVQIYLGGGVATTFTTADNGASFSAQKGFTDTLTVINNGLEYRTQDGVRYQFTTDVSPGMKMITQILDPNNNATVFGYTLTRGIQLPASITDASGRKITFTYPPVEDPMWDKIVKVMDTINDQGTRIVRYTYDVDGNLDTVKNNNAYQGASTESISTYTYDGTGHMLTYTNPLGAKLTNEYDGTGRVTKQYETNPRIDAPGTKRLVYSFAYADQADPNIAGSAHCSTLSAYRDANTKYDTKYCFNNDELKIYQADGLGNYEKWTYDGNGQILTHRNKNGDVATYTYDASRRLATETPPDTASWHSETVYTYENNFNRVLTKTETMWPLANPAKKTSRVTTYTVDGSTGNVKTMTDPLGKTVTTTYTNYGKLSGVYAKSGTYTEFAYETSGNFMEYSTTILKQADGSSQTVVVLNAHDAHGNVYASQDGRGNTTDYKYDSHGNLRKETNVNGDSKTYTYDAMDHRISMTDEKGNLTKYTYDSDLNASLIKVEQVGAKHTISRSRTYDYAGNLKTETDGNGNVTTYTYDDANRVHEKIGPRNTVTYGYDGEGNVTSEVNTLSEKTTHIYDERGRETEKRLYKTANTYVAEKTEYDGFGRVVKRTDGNINDTTYTYDALDHVLTKTDALGGVTTYRYDNDGNKAGERLPREETDAELRNQYGDSTTYFYDGFGRLIKEVNALDKITLHFYDENGNLLKTIDRESGPGVDASRVTLYEYYPLNWLKKQTFADGSHIDFTYDKVGNRLTKTDQENRTWSYGYDEFNRLISETDPATKVESYEYDDNNNKTLVTYRDKTTTQYQYNQDNLIKTIIDVQGNAESFTYDEVGRTKTHADKRNHTTLYTYDALGRPKTQTDAAGTVTTYTYDNNGNRLGVTVGLVDTIYIYDALNRLKTTTYPNGKTESVSYDENGNVKTTVDGKNQTISYTYDALGRMLGKVLPGNVATSYSYDNWNNLLSIDGPTEKVVNTYDVMNRVETSGHTLVDLNKKYTVNTEYMLDGQVKKRTDAAGAAIVYGYTTRGELQTVQYGTTTLAAYTYTEVGKPSTITYGNDLTATTRYDSVHRPTSLTVTDAHAVKVFDQEYTYDAAGNRMSFGDNGESTTTYKYDVLDQLTGVDYSTVNGVGSDDITYHYDDNGNRTSLVTPFGTTGYTFTAGTDQLASVSYNSGRLTVAAQYDNNGSLTKETYLRLGKADRQVTYSWDAQNRLSSITYTKQNRPGYMAAVPESKLAFAYDDAGNRLKKSVDGSDSYYINNGLNVLNEINAGGTVTNSMVMGTAQVAQIDAGGTITYSVSDVLGSTVLLTDGAGSIVNRYQYDPFGQLIGQEGSVQTNYLFTGQEFDGESELYYYNARYYSPALGRFISRDPMVGAADDTLGYNEYAYVRNNPLRYVDPTGLTPEQYLQKLRQDQLSWANQSYNSTQYMCTGSQKCTNVNPFVFLDVLPVSGDISDVYGLYTGKTLFGQTQLTKDQQDAIGAFAITPVLTAGEARVISKVDEGAEKVCVKYCDNVVEVSYHALDQMKNRNISLNQVQETIDNGIHFVYKQKGQILNGFYNKTSKIFVGIGSRVTTVINNVTDKYIINVMNRK